MSDDRQEPPAGEHDDDRTRPLPAAADRPEQPQPAQPAAEPDQTAPIKRPASPDETAPIDRAVPARPAESPDQTMPIDRSAGTQPGPPADRTARIPAEASTPPSWSGRAEVRPPRPAEPSGEWYVEEQGGPRWWLPILWGVLALLFAGLLGGALWLVLSQQDQDRDDPRSTRHSRQPVPPAPHRPVHLHLGGADQRDAEQPADHHRAGPGAGATAHRPAAGHRRGVAGPARPVLPGGVPPVGAAARNCGGHRAGGGHAGVDRRRGGVGHLCGRPLDRGDPDDAERHGDEHALTGAHHIRRRAPTRPRPASAMVRPKIPDQNSEWRMSVAVCPAGAASVRSS